ncbi:MAG: CrcB family protein [Planctomycetes bacterium]|nr:CrcB family protein [Planctomycetota bacterium]
MTQILLIAVAGALGTLLRLAISQATSSWNFAGFAWGTLLANALGCLLIGVIIGVGKEREILSPSLMRALTIGFLGALTTFSTFTADTALLWRADQMFSALGYALANLIAGFTLFYLGGLAARSL